VELSVAQIMIAVVETSKHVCEGLGLVLSGLIAATTLLAILLTRVSIRVNIDIADIVSKLGTLAGRVHARIRRRPRPRVGSSRYDQKEKNAIRRLLSIVRSIYS
jgi:hypothetical protein